MRVEGARMMWVAVVGKAFMPSAAKMERIKPFLAKPARKGSPLSEATARHTERSLIRDPFDYARFTRYAQGDADETKSNVSRCGAVEWV